MIPFLVVDRPASLRIIKGASSNRKIGLMSHANTTPLFRKLFKSYPCGEELCHAIDASGKTKCKVNFDASRCDVAQVIRQNTIKMCDCGMFTKDGSQYKYPELFKIYNDIGADYGIMLDVFRDKDATIESASKAIEIYKQQSYNFKLVFVAQGDSTEEYLACYDALKNLGGEYIAIGGLLQRVKNTARYVQVRSETDMEDVLRKIKEKFSPEWLFALGCYHPKRHEIFEELGLWGSDYKGWIFQYKKRERLIQLKWEEITAKLSFQGLSEHRSVSALNISIKERSELVKQQEKEGHKKSFRNVSLEDRSPELIKLDTNIQSQLKNVKQNAYLDGTKRSIEKLSTEISQLAQKTEQQIRYEQVRTLIRGFAN